MKYARPLNLFRDLLKRNAHERGRFLGLDVGDKYVGLAVSDPDNKIASPLSVLFRKKTKMHLMAQDFQNLISELSLAGFIVGYPFKRQRHNVDAVQVKIFIDDLCKTGKLEGVKYTYWDECFTSKNVELLIKPLKLPPILSKTIIDKFAAVGILQVIYLDKVGRVTWIILTEDQNWKRGRVRWIIWDQTLDSPRWDNFQAQSKKGRWKFFDIVVNFISSE